MKHNYQETMWAEQSPDCYDGPDCDQLRAAWSCYCDGDKDGEDGLPLLELAAETFPYGTKVVVLFPICPNEDCDLHADFANELGKCPCGFDWNEWALNKYG